MQINKLLNFQIKISCFILIILTLIIYKANTTIVKANTTSETWSIRTTLDRFVIRKGAGGQYFINGQKVHLNVFNQLKDFVNNKLAFADQDIGDKEDGCSKPRGRPDLQILRTRAGKQDKQIAVYIDERILLVNQRCSSIEGDGIFALPMHREWYIGPQTIQIDIGTRRKFIFNKSKSIEYRGSMSSQDKKIKLLVNGSFMPDWGKINLFEKRISSIQVSGRRHLSYTKNNPRFTFITNNQKYTFYEIRNPSLVWALKLPNKPFLIMSSKSFSWHEFNLEHVVDPRSDAINILKDSDNSTNKRISAFETLDNYWNPSFQRILFAIFKDEDEPAPLRRKIAEILIQKPTSLNKTTLLNTLLRTQAPSLREYISQRLKLFHPKGKAISANDDNHTVNEKMNTWRGLKFQ